MQDAETAFLRIQEELESLKLIIKSREKRPGLGCSVSPGINVASRFLDRPTFLGETSTWIIASEKRSGSHLLASLLRSTQQAGVPFEYFHKRHWKEWRLERGKPSSSEKALYLSLIKHRTTANGLFSFKAHWDQFAFFSSLGLEHYARSAKFIRIRRKDILAQAVSLAIAKQTGAWSYDQTIRKQPRYSFQAVKSAILCISRESFMWTTYLTSNCIQSYDIWYEDICENRYSTMRRLCEFMGIEWRAGLSESTKIQRTAVNLEWMEAYRNDARKYSVPASKINTWLDVMP